MMKLVNIDEGNLHNFRTTRGISMKFSGKMRLMTISKVAKIRTLPLSRKQSFVETAIGVKLTPPPAFLGLKME